MSVQIQKEVHLGSYPHFKINLEVFDNGYDVVETSSNRSIQDGRFQNLRVPGALNSSFNGVSSYDEAVDLMKNGYKEAAKRIDKELKITLDGNSKRTSFRNEVVGFIPVVPLVLQGVPNCMVNSYTKPIKTKVLNVYYDVGAVGNVSTSEIEQAGTKLLNAMIQLELQGYRFNLYAIKTQTKYDGCCDMLCVKIKNASSPLDVKRLSFPLAHAAFFRCIAWDWYMRNPNSIYRVAYGHGLTYEFSSKELSEAFEKLFNQKCVVLGCKYILDKGEDYIKEILSNGGKEKKR